MRSLLDRAVRHTPMALAIGVLACWSTVVIARDVPISVGQDLQSAVDQSRDGERLVLAPGKHVGPVIISQSITLTGEQGAIIDGQGEGRVVTLDAPGAVLAGLTVINSGSSLATEDSGIYVTARARGARVLNNRLEQNLIGIYLKGTPDARVEGNTIVGRRDLRVNERGNGVQLWNATGSEVIGNRIRHGRDGIFVTTSQRNRFHGNRFEDLRFAVHYMYTNDSEISDNVSIGNHVGYAIMYSHRLRIQGNRSSGDRDRGLFLNYANYSEITDNTVTGGAEKCLFVYNASGNRVADNLFRDCAIGIHFTAGSEDNAVHGNAFVGNRQQVKYVGSRHVEWSVDGRGNYWSDNAAYDLDGDGLADRPYQPNTVADQVVWRYPLAKLLFNSPAMDLLRWAQSRFPSLHPGGVTDSAPLMANPATGSGNG